MVMWLIGSALCAGWVLNSWTSDSFDISDGFVGCVLLVCITVVITLAVKG